MLSECESDSTELQLLLEEIQKKTIELVKEKEDIKKVDAGTQINKVEDQKEAQTEASTSNENNSEQKNKATTKLPEINIPIYGPVVNLETSSWEISEPIFLVGLDQEEQFSSSRNGLILDKGFYKIVYTFVNIKPGTGLALFETSSEKFIKLLTYVPYSGAQKDTTIVFEKNKIYVQVKKVEILGITNSNLEYKPKTIEGTILVTIHRLKETPK